MKYLHTKYSLYTKYPRYECSITDMCQYITYHDIVSEVFFSNRFSCIYSIYLRNVNGLRACMGKGFMEFFEQADADIFCLQEIKLQEGQIDWKKEGYYAYWNYAEKKGYSGNSNVITRPSLSCSSIPNP